MLSFYFENLTMLCFAGYGAVQVEQGRGQSSLVFVCVWLLVALAVVVARVHALDAAAAATAFAAAAFATAAFATAALAAAASAAAVTASAATSARRLAALSRLDQPDVGGNVVDEGGRGRWNAGRVPFDRVCDA